MTDTGARPALFFPGLALAAATKLGVHLATAPGYGIFRDELYYLACADHLAFGYVDHAPLIAWTTWLSRALLGTSLLALRLLPALASTATLIVAVLLCRSLGGGKLAQILTAVCTLSSGYLLAVGHLATMNAHEPLIWAAAMLLLLRALQTGRTTSFIALGVVLGVGLSNKHSLLFFGFALVVAIAVTRARRLLFGWRSWVALAVALALFAPNLLWQAAHGWPTLEFMRGAQAAKHTTFTPLAFLKEQILLGHPLALPVWGAALVQSALPAAQPRERIVGVSYGVLFLVVLIGGGKPYYVAPIYPIAYAAGAPLLERWASGAGRRWVIPAACAIVAASGAALAPIAMPILPAETLARYAHALGAVPSSGERHEQGRLPQHFADMHGWRELAAAVAHVRDGLSEHERRELVIVTENYGEAGAIDFFGPALGLPRATSGHNGYYLWGPGDRRGEVVIAVGLTAQRLREMFAEVTLAGTADHPLAMPHQRNTELFVCRRPVETWPELWPRFKRYR